MENEDLQQALSEIQAKALRMVQAQDDAMNLVFKLATIIKELLARIE